MMLAIDLDGVLASFDQGVFNLLGQYPRDLQKKLMWKTLASTPDFYTNLEWMPDGEELWNHCKVYNPTILTGLPLGNWAAKQKRVWCGNKLGWGVPVITCMAKEKQDHGKPGDILIDDNRDNIQRWKDMGGIGILHVNAKQSIKELEDYLNGD